MQVTALHPHFDALQQKFGDKNLSAVYGAGCLKSPKICFVFMNPTARNIATNPDWRGLRAQWLGIKLVWRLFAKLEVISNATFSEIEKLKPAEWTPELAQRLYEEVAANGFYITNLAKCTQADAHSLPDAFFNAYRDLFLKELSLVNPRAVVSFGNQVSSVLCGQEIKVSLYQGKSVSVIDGSNRWKVWPTYYPVGQGFRHTPLAIKNIRHVLSTLKN